MDDDDWTATGSHRSEDHRIMSEGGRGRRRMHKKDKNSPRRKKWKTSNSNNSSNNGDSNHSGGALSSSAPAVSGVPMAGTRFDYWNFFLLFFVVIMDLFIFVSGLTEGGLLSSGPSDFTGAAGMETMAVSDRRTILSSMCGVVSEHTGRMCTRSLRCPQHTDVQRKGVRQVMLENDSLLDAAAVAGIGLADKDKEIDVDTWEEGDSLASLLTAQVFLRLSTICLNSSKTPWCIVIVPHGTPMIQQLTRYFYFIFLSKEQ